MSDTNELSSCPKYQPNQFVRKIGGAHFWGQILPKPYRTVPGSQWHYNVMAVHPDFYGTVHILVESQLELLPKGMRALATPSIPND